MRNRETMFSSKTPEWGTPQALFDELNKEFKFTLDPCATKKNAKTKRYFSVKQDGLSQNWDSERVFCNPPYGSETGKWVKKGAETRGGGCCYADSSTNRHKILS